MTKSHTNLSLPRLDSFVMQSMTIQMGKAEKTRMNMICVRMTMKSGRPKMFEISPTNVGAVEVSMKAGFREKSKKLVEDI